MEGNLWARGGVGGGRAPHKEGRSRGPRGHSKREEWEPSWELPPLLGDTVVAGNNLQQRSRPTQATAQAEGTPKVVPLGYLAPPKAFCALLQEKGDKNLFHLGGIELHPMVPWGPSLHHLASGCGRKLD